MTVPRVLLGKKGSNFGLWVSKPSIDVTTAADPDDMMVSINQKTVQIVESGIIASLSNGGSYNVTLPDQGFYPIIFYNCGSYQPYLEYISHTSINFHTFTYSFTSGGLPYHDGSLRYSVTNIDSGF